MIRKITESRWIGPALAVFGNFTDDTGNLQGRGICSFYKSDQHLYGVYRHWIIRR